MKTSVVSDYFVWPVVCFVMVFSSCDIDGWSSGKPPEASIIYPTSMRPGKTYTFEVEAEDPDGDRLTYSWSVEDEASRLTESNSYLESYALLQPPEDLGQFSSTTEPVVSYTTPKQASGLLFISVTVSDGTHEVYVNVSYSASNSVWESL